MVYIMKFLVLLALLWINLAASEINDSNAPKTQTYTPRNYGAAAVFTLSSLSKELGAYEACRPHLVELLNVQRRPFVAICSVNLPTALSAEQTREWSTHVILTPMHTSDYDALVAIDATYGQEQLPNHFLRRCYPEKGIFEEKLAGMYRGYAANPLAPVFYHDYAGKDDELDFASSTVFSIMGVDSENLSVRGDLWLSNIIAPGGFKFCDYSTERSTMTGGNRSRGLAQAAVRMLNEELVKKQWFGKPICFIGVTSTILANFGGVFAYVEPTNAESIGNNFRSGGTLIGINPDGKYFIFKYQPSFEGATAPENLQQLRALAENLYPNEKSIASSIWMLTSEPSQQKRTYIRSKNYQEVLAALKQLVESNTAGILIN